MTKTLFILSCFLVAFAHARYPGRLENVLLGNDEHTDCRRGESSNPKKYYVSLVMVPFGRRLAYTQKPGIRKLFFSPKNAMGNTPLPFEILLCSKYSIAPSPNFTKPQQLYADKDLQLYMADYDLVMPMKYSRVQLHFRSNKVYTRLKDHIGMLCLKPGEEGAMLSSDCGSYYNLVPVKKSKLIDFK
ncbi:uncharacterized protein LOC114519109 [Dendronephthya gigantea]|uniref:uncharacterized protein LOC114519109 n=1 Tax=Dendronephthya gigantea TaxID=151771 RepID=UPI00106B99AA|nr:uncharacterized protein LOC114519109 [Dendronephthya gigantea]